MLNLRFSHTFKTAARAATLVAGLLSANACVTTPLDSTELSSRTSSFIIEGYAANANAQINVQAKNSSGGWTTINTTLHASSSPLPWDNRLFRVYGPISIGAAYWTYNAFADRYLAEIRLIEVAAPGGNQVSNPLKTFNQGGIDCLYEDIGQGEDFIAAGANCYTGTTITLLAP